MMDPSKPAILALLLVTRMPAADVAVLTTCFDDGDARQAALESGRPWKHDIHQDENHTLLRSATTPLVDKDPGAAVTFTIDRTKAWQTMLGYGAAMTDSSAFVLMNLKQRNPELYQFTMTRLFSPDKGAGFSFMRLAMGASDYVSTGSYYTYCDEESKDLAAFSIAPDKRFIIPALKDALRINPEIKLLASPWSAPAWMKTNGKLGGVGVSQKQDGATAELRDDCFDLYADYFVKFIEAYRAEGIPIYGVTLQNEPQNDLSTYPCMRMDETDQIRFVKLLGPRLAAEKLKTRIYIHDHNWVLHPNDRKVLGGDAKMDPVESVTRILSDPDAARHIAGSAWHCYSGGTDQMKHACETIHQRFPDKQILTTELSGWGKSRGAWWPSVDWGLAHNWLGASLHWSEASLQWNLALDDKYGPTPRTDSAAVGLVTIHTDDYQNVGFEREFYAMAQISRAVRPGAKRIGSAITSGDGRGLETIAFALPHGGTSLVVVNRNGGVRSFQISDRGHWFSHKLSGHSMVTFVW